jgi:hypothetical protein
MTFVAQVAVLVVGWVVVVGPLAALLALLNHRDRRAEALFRRVADQLPGEALRSDLAVGVRCALWSRAATVRLDLRGTPSTGLWETAARLRSALPRWVRLEVEGRVEGTPAPGPVRVTVESAGPAALRPAA